MRTRQTLFSLLASGATFLALSLQVGSRVEAQGSIYGTVRNFDFSTPSDSEIQLLGFIGNTDNEIRIQTCVGAGYESGNWYDDFQNYVGEAAGMPYRYYFFNQSKAEGALLEALIPTNSFERRDINLAPATFPAPAQKAWAAIEPGGDVRLMWLDDPDVTWHVYRRSGSSGGSFFRIDNPDGNLADPGVSNPPYIDSDVIDSACYHYVLVTESAPGNYSPATEVLQIDLSTCCQGKVGDVNGIGGDEPSIGDVALLIDHLFISGTNPDCMLEADINQSGGLNPTRDNISIGDASWLIDHLFISGIALLPCLD